MNLSNKNTTKNNWIEITLLWIGSEGRLTWRDRKKYETVRTELRMRTFDYENISQKRVRGSKKAYEIFECVEAWDWGLRFERWDWRIEGWVEGFCTDRKALYWFHWICVRLKERGVWFRRSDWERGVSVLEFLSSFKKILFSYPAEWKFQKKKRIMVYRYFLLN